MTNNTLPHISTFRVYYEDTDAGGVMYYANYLKFAERARTEWLRELGFEQTALKRDTGIIIVVRRCECDYLAPAKLDDLLTVETRLQEVGKVRMTMQQTIKRGEKTISMLLVVLACVDESGKPIGWPKLLTDAFV